MVAEGAIFLSPTNCANVMYTLYKVLVAMSQSLLGLELGLHFFGLFVRGFKLSSKLQSSDRIAYSSRSIQAFRSTCLLNCR